MKRVRFAAAVLGLLLLGACAGTSFTVTEWRPELQARSSKVSLSGYSAALDPWSNRYVLTFQEEMAPGAKSPRSLVLELDHTIPDGNSLDGETYLKAWRYESGVRAELTSQNSKLKAGKLSFHRLPEEYVKGSFDLLFISKNEGEKLYGELNELQITGTFRVTMSPPKTR